LNRRAHHTDYNEQATRRCERALVTLLGDLGPWRERIYLAGGLAPRYLVGQLPEGARAHVGTTDVDLIVGVALADETSETYRTLQNNLEKSSSSRATPASDGSVRSRASLSRLSSSARPTRSRPVAYSVRKNSQDRSLGRSTSVEPISRVRTSSNAKSGPSASMVEACLG
jgi:hypothetical protein